MPKRSSKPPTDPNQAAHDVVKRLTGSEDDTEPTDEERKAIAAILGRRGGEKGGRARAEKLSPKRRSEIARKAAKARWKRDDS